MKTLKDITGDSLEQMIDFKVIDQNGDNIGTLYSLWSDPTTGAVEFLGVKTGWLFGHNHVVPADKAELDETGNVIRLPYTTGFVKEAPTMSADAEISEAEEADIYRYYGLGSHGGAVGGTMAAPDVDLDNLPETTVTGSGRLRRTSRPETSGETDSFASSIRDAGATVNSGAAVRSALDALVPGGGGSEAGVLSTGETPSSYGTTNLYGSTGTVTPVASDSAGSLIGEAGATSTGGLSPAGKSATADPTQHGVNADPLTGEPGSHPVGVGAGALSAGAAGAAAGAAIGGPIGGAVGAAIGGVAGAVVGGYAGRAIGESINPTDENAHWEVNYRSTQYYDSALDYNDYAPAYRTGYEGFGQYWNAGRGYDEMVPELERDYARNRGSSRLTWEKAQVATRDAWERLHKKFSEARSR